MKLTKGILLQAVTKSLENAGQLLEEGKILKANKSFARAYTLYQLSIEEVGKASMSFGFLLFQNYEDDENQKKFLKDYRDHKIKTKKAAGIDFMLAMTIGTNEVKRALIDNIQKQYENNSKLNDLKNYSLYTSFREDYVIKPDEIVDEKLANDLEFYALIRYESARQYYGLATTNFEQMVAAKNELDMDKLFKETEEYLDEIYKDDVGE